MNDDLVYFLSTVDDGDVNDLFPVQLTAVTDVSGTFTYDWTEQSFDTTLGDYEDAQGGRSGDASSGPFMVEINNNEVDVPCYVWARLRGIVDGQPYYEFCQDTATSSSPDATCLTPGIVNTGTQTFCGDKTFGDTVTVDDKLTVEREIDVTDTGSTPVQIIGRKGSEAYFQVTVENDVAETGSVTLGSPIVGGPINELLISGDDGAGDLSGHFAASSAGGSIYRGKSDTDTITRFAGGIWVDGPMPTGYSSSGVTSIGAGNGVSTSASTGAVNISVNATKSVSASTGGVSLLNDQTLPGSLKLYGTDAGGTKGWYSQPTSTSGTVTSVGLTMPAGWNVLGSPISTSGSFVVSSPLTSTGDLLYRSTSGEARLPIGSDGKVLTVAGGLPGWSSLTSAGVTSISATAPIAASASTGAVTISLATTGTAGTYTKVTTDNWGRVTSGTTLSVSDLPALNGFTDADPALDDRVPIYDTSAAANRDTQASYLLALSRLTPGGRLSAFNSDPITDATAVSTIYYMPYLHDMICLWDGTRWVWVTFTETSLAIGTVTANRPYDIFGYLSGGVLTLEKLIWTSDSARATAVTIQDGRYCKSGDKTRLLLGTFRPFSTTAFDDFPQSRTLVNMYNAVPRHLHYCPGYSDDNASTTYTFTGANWSEVNAGDAHVGFLAALPYWDGQITLTAWVAAAAGASGYLAIGLDSTTTAKCSFRAEAAGTEKSSLTWGGPFAAGYHYFAILGKLSSGTGTITADVQRFGGATDPEATYLDGWVMG